MNISKDSLTHTKRKSFGNGYQHIKNCLSHLKRKSFYKQHGIEVGSDTNTESKIERNYKLKLNR